MLCLLGGTTGRMERCEALNGVEASSERRISLVTKDDMVVADLRGES